jgi:hypothetical protein
MRTISYLSIIGAAFCLAGSPVARAQTADGSVLFNSAVNLSLGPQNGHVGSAGGVFLTSSSYWPYVNWLGYYDKDGDGLANSHEISIWYTGGQGGSTATEVAHATVPAGTTAPLYNGYRWVQLPPTGSGPNGSVGLWYGSWYTIAAQTDGVDTWGDLISGGQAGWGSQYLDIAGNEWSRAGRYDTAASWPNSPVNQVGTTDSIFPVANMGYNLPIIPEPSTAGIMAVGLTVLFAARRKQNN